VSDLDAELADIFRDEAAERLGQMETALLAVESGSAGAESVDSLFRNVHTIKGAAGMLGYDDIRALAHAVEDVLARVRETAVFPPGLAALLLRATTALGGQVTGTGEPADEIVADLAASLAASPGGAAGNGRTVGNGRTAGQGGAAGQPGAQAGDDVAGPVVAGPVVAGPVVAGPVVAGPVVAGPVVAGPVVAGPVVAGPVEEGLVAAGPVAEGPAAEGPAAASPRWAGEPEAAGGGEAPGSPIKGRPLRVPAGKIDRLLDIVGEFMQYRGRLTHSLSAQAIRSPAIAEILTASGRMFDELAETATGMRTLPLATITRQLPRAVRDLALAAGKDVEFVVTGADTELDRVILESLYDPLAHLLRNAVTHGIESPAERGRAGKPARGRLELRAVPRGSLVEIVVADDGKGVSPEVIEQARHAGSLAEVLTRSGFSTAAEVTDLAGRGVGLDAVRDYARSVRGSLEVRSEPGQGMEVVLLLPVALALLEVLLFERAGRVYGVPLVAVEEVITAGQTLLLEGRPALEIRGRPLPVADICALVGAAAPPLGDRPPALVISVGGRSAIVTCDFVIRQEEVVVKPLGPLLDGRTAYLGAAILGDGRIALLVDPGMLARESWRLPAAGAPSARGPTIGGLAAREPAAAPAPKVLVVEDSFIVRELQRSILETAGYPVVTACDGREALAALDRDPEIALVVTDLQMPELDGLGLTRAIRASAARSSLPVIIVTSRGSDDDRRQGAAAGADAYMVKQSFDQQALLATVEHLVGR